MKTVINVLLILCCFFSISIAQPKVVHFKKLQEFLPSKEIPGYKRNKPTGNTTTTMGITVSEASVRFAKPAASDSESEKSIEIKISDMSLFPFAAWGMATQQTEYENETEDGYEKANTGEYKYCSLEFVVGTRFHLSIQVNGTDDAKLLISLAEGMNLEKLEQLQSDK